MQSIAPLSEENISGLQNLQFIPVDDVLQVPRALNSQVTTSVGLKPAKSWYTLAFTQQTASFVQEEDLGANGAFYKLAVTGIIPKMKLATEETLQLMRENLFIVIATDNNGYRRLCGSLAEPLRFKYSANSKAEFGVRNEYSFAFYRELRNPAPFYNV